MDNILQINDFISGEKLHTSELGDACFDADVIYEDNRGSVSSRTKVHIIRSGYSNDGDIEIFATDELPAAEYQLYFVDKLQTYHYHSESSALIIKGKPEVQSRGEYTVTITPH